MADQAESLQNDLWRGEGGLRTEPTKALMRIAAILDQSEDSFKQWFISEDPAKVWSVLKADYSEGEIYQRFQKFLDDYGFRCVDELKLESKDLHDDPSFAVLSVDGYVR